MKTPHSEQPVLLTIFELGTLWILVYYITIIPVCLVSKSMASQESYKITCSLFDNISMLSFSVFMVRDLNKFFIGISETLAVPTFIETPHADSCVR